MAAAGGAFDGMFDDDRQQGLITLTWGEGRALEGGAELQRRLIARHPGLDPAAREAPEPPRLRRRRPPRSDRGPPRRAPAQGPCPAPGARACEVPLPGMPLGLLPLDAKLDLGPEDRNRALVGRTVRFGADAPRGQP